jgi:hypothetical protein
MLIFKDETGTSAFAVLGYDGCPTGAHISWLFEKRNGKDFTFGFNPDQPHALMIAIAEFEVFLDENGGKEVADA